MTALRHIHLSLAVAWLLGGLEVVAIPTRPNVLFLVVDDLRPKLSCYGESNMVTPNIDNFASRSIQFERAYVQQAVCSPSRTSFLTGRRPDTTRIFDLQTYFRHATGNYTTLPQHFKDNGYVTQSVGKIFHPGVASGNTDDYPYSWTYPAYHAPTQAYHAKGICPGPDGKLHRYAVCPLAKSEMPEGSLPDIQNADYAIEFLQNRSRDERTFFLGMGFHKPHLSFRFPKEYLDLYPMSKIHLAPNPFYPPWLPSVAWSPWDELHMYEDIQSRNVSFPYGFVPVEYELKLRQAYSAAVSYTDAQVGRVLHALDEYGLADNTIISFIGDHGWQLGEHGEWCKHTNFEIATRVPMFIYIPGVTSKRSKPGNTFPFFDALADSKSSGPSVLRYEPEKPAEDRTSERNIKTDALVEAVDLYPTLSELCGLDVPDTCPPDPFHVELCTEGASLVPLIKNLTSATPGSPLAWKPAVFSQYPRPSLKPGPNSTTPLNSEVHFMGYTMRTDHHRYTEWVAYDPKTFTPDWTKVVAHELYDHTNDPLENLNVADQMAYKDVVASLSKQLRDGWRNALPKTTV